MHIVLSSPHILVQQKCPGTTTWSLHGGWPQASVDHSYAKGKESDDTMNAAIKEFMQTRSDASSIWSTCTAVGKTTASLWKHEMQKHGAQFKPAIDYLITTYNAYKHVVDQEVATVCKPEYSANYRLGNPAKMSLRESCRFCLRLKKKSFKKTHAIQSEIVSLSKCKDLRSGKKEYDFEKIKAEAKAKLEAEKKERAEEAAEVKQKAEAVEQAKVVAKKTVTPVASATPVPLAAATPSAPALPSAASSPPKVATGISAASDDASSAANQSKKSGKKGKGGKKGKKGGSFPSLDPTAAAN